MKLTGGQIVARALKEYGVEYVAGVPDTASGRCSTRSCRKGSEIPFIQVMHEQSAVHMADGYYRASGKPMACSTSVGPGAANTIIGLATAYCDSTSLFYVSGSPQTYMHGHGTMQELERQQDNAFPRITEQVTKRAWQGQFGAGPPKHYAPCLQRMLTGRPGPVHVEVPMDVQVEAADVTIHPLGRSAAGRRRLSGSEGHRSGAEGSSFSAERPVIVAGGGAITANASAELTRLAEKLGAAVSITWNGKGAISEDHALFIGAVGQTGTTCGNQITASADVVCRSAAASPTGRPRPMPRASPSRSRRPSSSISISIRARSARTTRPKSASSPMRR
jgi:acetolactate synthase-1/2/3 large subunit